MVTLKIIIIVVTVLYYVWYDSALFFTSILHFPRNFKINGKAPLNLVRLGHYATEEKNYIRDKTDVSLYLEFVCVSIDILNPKKQFCFSIIYDSTNPCHSSLPPMLARMLSLYIGFGKNFIIMTNSLEESYLLWLHEISDENIYRKVECCILPSLQTKLDFFVSFIIYFVKY